MIDELKVAAVQMPVKQVVFNSAAKDENVEHIVSYIRSLGKGNDLVVFPELATCGYTPFGYSAKYKIKLWEAADDFENSSDMHEILESTKETDCLFVIGFAEKTRIKYDFYNSAALVMRGNVLGIHRKIHLAGEEGHFFTPGPEPKVFRTRIGNIGMGLCYDMVFPEMARVLAVKGAEIMIFPAGWADIGNLSLISKVLPVARAVENQTFTIFCNGVGVVGTEHFHISFMGESRIVSPTGTVLAESTTDREEVVTALLKKRDLEEGASIYFIFRDRQIGSYQPLTQPYC